MAAGRLLRHLLCPNSYALGFFFSIPKSQKNAPVKNPPGVIAFCSLRLTRGCSEDFHIMTGVIGIPRNISVTK